eukprot:3969233-Prymnesium_polylepis.2
MTTATKPLVAAPHARRARTDESELRLTTRDARTPHERRRRARWRAHAALCGRARARHGGALQSEGHRGGVAVRCLPARRLP